MSCIKIRYGTKDLDINIVSVNTRCADISVGEDLTIVMRVPAGMQWDMIRNYVQMNEQEIIRDYEAGKLHNYQMLPMTLELQDGQVQYRNGMVLPFLGDMNLHLRIKYSPDIPGTRIYTEEKADGNRTLELQANTDDQKFLRYCITRFYKKKAEEIVREKAGELSRKMNLSYNAIQITGPNQGSCSRLSWLTNKNIEIKNQKTLWGSCNNKKNLRFDWKMAMLPMEIVEYIIIHELTHLKKMNHSGSFWQEIENVMPEYEECRNWLDKHGKDYEIF